MRWFNEFHAGVALFFVLSGFLIAYTYADVPVKSGKNYLHYILLRMARIMPLYWLILTFYYFDNSFGKHQFTWLTYSLVHGFSNEHNLDAIAQAWSLTVEMSFYFLAPLLYYLLDKKWWLLLFALAVLFFATWGFGFYWHKVNGNVQEFFYPVKFIATSIFTGRSLEFAAGMLLAYALKNNKTKWLDKIRNKTLFGFLGTFVTMYLIGLFQPTIFDHGYDTVWGMILSKLILPAIVVICLYGLIKEKNRVTTFFASKPLVLLGNASFAFYLVHVSYVNLKIKNWVLFPDRNFLLLWVVAIILYIGFEKPLYDFCRKKLK